ncbi:hypothetical protein [Paenibacillus sp. MBLB4367]|uniref:hypothetical protein n=1 Tax=Paenibacillus sp. MBLB4367 TaxID=3384767 RepID=UPI00390812E8
MPEKAIMAYFHSPEEASGIAAKLAALRVTEVKVGRVEGFPIDHAYEGMFPVTGYVSGLPGLTTDASLSLPDTAVLLSADPNASGMSGGTDLLSRDDESAGNSAYATRNIALTAIVDETIFDKACRLIEQGGGMM